MRIIIYILIGLVIAGCGFQSTVDKNRFDTLFPDSLFQHPSKVDINDNDLRSDYDPEKREYKLKSLSESQRALLTKEILGEKPYAAYFISKQNNVLGFKPILVYTDVDDYSSILLIILTPELKVSDHIDLTGNICDSPEQIDNEVTVTCHERYSKFLNDSTIRITNLNTFITGYDETGETTRTDSVTLKYRITNNGKIKLLHRDSIQYSRVTK